MNSSQDPSQLATKTTQVPGPPYQGPKGPSIQLQTTHWGLTVSSDRKQNVGTSRGSGGGLKEGIGQDLPQCPHSCQGIVTGTMTQKVSDIEGKSFRNKPSLVPNGISLLPHPIQHPHPTAPPFYYLQSSYLVSEILPFISLLLVVLPFPSPPWVLVPHGWDSHITRRAWYYRPLNKLNRI